MIYSISVQWAMYGTYEVEAESEDGARAYVDLAPLPDGDYMEGSFQILDVVEMDRETFQRIDIGVAK